MNPIYLAAHLVPVAFYAVLVYINATVRPERQKTIDGWVFALVMCLVAIASGILRGFQLDTWFPIWLLSIIMTGVQAFVTLIGAVVGTGMLLSYTSTTPVRSNVGWLTERREMTFLSIAGGLSLLVIVFDGCVLGGLLQQPM